VTEANPFNYRFYYNLVMRHFLRHSVHCSTSQLNTNHMPLRFHAILHVAVAKSLIKIHLITTHIIYFNTIYSLWLTFRLLDFPTHLSGRRQNIRVHPLVKKFFIKTVLN